jgi:hypothetical protein
VYCFCDRPTPDGRYGSHKRGVTEDCRKRCGWREEGTQEVANDQELEMLANRLRDMVMQGKLGTRSLWALGQMVECWEGKQLNGIGSFRIEPAERGQVEVAFTSNATEVSTRWEFG